MKLFNSLFLFLLFFIIGCTVPSEKYSQVELVSKRIIEIPINENTSNDWWTLQYLDLKSNEYLVYHDRIKSQLKKIHFYNLQDREKSFDVEVEIEGPNGVGHLDSFYVRNLDSIFVLNQYAYRLYLIDTSGIVKDMFQLIGDNLQGTSEITYLPIPLPWTPIVDLGNKLIFPARPDVNTTENYTPEIYKTGISLDLDSKAFSYEFDFSASYFNSGFWGFHLELPSFTVNFKDSLLIQSFPIDDRVMVYDFDLSLLDSPSLFKEYYEGAFHSLIEPTQESDIFYPHIFSNPSNMSILWDPYRELYYRIFSGPYSQEIIERRRKNNFAPLTENNEYPERRIMIFDREFKEIGVLELDKEKYSVQLIRVVKEGLLIPAKSNDEDKNVFEIFEVKY
jgi:hypothetical protein